MQDVRQDLAEMKNLGRNVQTELFTMAVRLLEES